MGFHIGSPFSYIVPVLPHPMPTKLFKSEHFVLTDLLKLILGSSLQADSGVEPLAWLDYLPLFAKDPKLAPQAAKEKKKNKEENVGRVKAADEGLEGFVDWGEPTASGLAKDKEGDMSSLVAGFTAQMRKRATDAHGETTPGSEGPGDKYLRRSGLEEEA